MGRRNKQNLSLYVSKQKNKKDRTVGSVGSKVKHIGRPRSLKRPLPTWDLDETLPYEQFTTDECPMDDGDEMDFQFSVSVQPEHSVSEACAGAGGDPDSWNTLWPSYTITTEASCTFMSVELSHRYSGCTTIMKIFSILAKQISVRSHPW